MNAWTRRWTGWFESKAWTTRGRHIRLPREDAQIERLRAWDRRLP